MNPKHTILYFLLLFFFVACSQEPVLTLEGRTMGTFYTVKIAEELSEDAQMQIQKTIDTVLHNVNQSLNRYDPASEISRFNKYRSTDAFQVSKDLLEVTKTADFIYRRSEGAFDPTIARLVSLWGFGEDGEIDPPQEAELEAAMQHMGFDKIIIEDKTLSKSDPLLQLDYSAIAKGYGVDRLMESLNGQGYRNVLVEIGGEVRVSGTRHGKLWRIGIADPDKHEREYSVSETALNLQDMACATSGDYQQFYIFEGERYSHLIDPKTGRPINHEVTSVTVIAGTCMLADAAATAAIVLGKDRGMAFVESLPGVEAYFIYHDGNALQSAQSSDWGK